MSLSESVQARDLFPYRWTSPPIRRHSAAAGSRESRCGSCCRRRSRRLPCCPTSSGSHPSPRHQAFSLTRAALQRGSLTEALVGVDPTDGRRPGGERSGRNGGDSRRRAESRECCNVPHAVPRHVREASHHGRFRIMHAGLENRYGRFRPSRVRIPPPPLKFGSVCSDRRIADALAAFTPHGAAAGGKIRSGLASGMRSGPDSSFSTLSRLGSRSQTDRTTQQGAPLWAGRRCLCVGTASGGAGICTSAGAAIWWGSPGGSWDVRASLSGMTVTQPSGRCGGSPPGLACAHVANRAGHPGRPGLDLLRGAPAQSARGCSGCDAGSCAGPGCRG